MKINLISYLFFCLIVGSTALNAQVTPYHYSIPTDVSNQLIFCIEQDQHGRLLIGTDNGLYRYNGFRSTKIQSIGAFSKEITKIIRVGEQFVMTNRAGQVLELKDDQLHPLILNELTGDIRSISVQGAYLEITTQKNNFSYSIPNYDLVEKEAIPFTESAGVFANDFLYSKNKRFAVLNSGEIIDVDQSEARYIPKATGKQLIQFSNQLVIIPSYTANENVYSYSNGQFQSFGPLASRRNVNVNKAKQIGNKLFVLTDYGVFVYQTNLKRLPTLWFEGIAVTDIFEDAQKNMWIATKGKGLLYIPAGRHEIVNSTSFLSIQNGQKGSFFGGNANGIITQFNDEGEKINQFSNPTSNQEIQFLYVDSYSQLIFTNSYIFPISPQYKSIASNEALRSVSRLKTGELMLSKSSGILLYKKNNSTKDFLNHFSDSNYFRVLSKEPGRQIATNLILNQTAVATENGLYIYTDNQPLKSISYYGKPIDAQSMAWFGSDLYVGTRNNKILVIRAGKVIGERSLSSGFGELLIIKMISTNQYLYLLTEKGIYRLKSMKSKMETLKDVIGFDGLAMRDFTIKNDELHIATQRGVLRYAWNQVNKIETSMVVGNPYAGKNATDSKTSFDSDEKLIVIPFECVDLSGNHQFLIQYRIHTEDERGIWNSLPANSEQINFSHLNSGEYTIEMRMLDPIARLASKIETRQFSITESWYEAAWLNWFVFGVISTCFVLFFIRRYELKTRFDD